MKRIATYCIYDPKGDVARHKTYFITQLLKFVDRLVIVCNGNLTAEGRDTLEQFTEDVIVRENVGFDWWAHRTGIEYIGWDELQSYDEYLLCNDICYGAVLPLEDMFDGMSERDCDFWGPVLCPEDKSVKSVGVIPFPGGYSMEYLWSIFINVKSKLLQSYEFKSFWDNLKKMSTMIEALVYGEYHFTYYFSNCGYKCDSWCDPKVYERMPVTISRHVPYRLLKENRVPFLRRKAVNGSIPLSDFWALGYGNEAYKAIEYLEQKTDYDAGMIWDDILRNNHLSRIQARLQLEYILPENRLEREYTYKKKIAVICHIYYADLVEECASYSENFPKDTDFYLSTTSEETLTEIHREYGKRNFNYQVQVIPNIGRDAPALFVAYSHIVTNGDYEYICYFHDKKVPQSEYKEIGLQFKLRCFNSLFGTKSTVMNIINRFEDNPRLGVLTNPMPYTDTYFAAFSRTWKRNYENIKELADRIGLDIPLSMYRYEPSAYGTKLWFRAAALKKMLSHKFTFEDFEHATPDKHDCTISHAIERIYGIAAQDSGYYLAYALSNDQARSDLSNYRAMLFGCEGILPLIQKYGLGVGSFNSVLHGLEETLKSHSSFKEKYQQIKYQSNPIERLPPLNPQEYLETVSTRLLIKKLVKRFIPKNIWKSLANKHQKKLIER
jgi:rhamnosyltransferase